jgi:hypothetical protein
LWATLRCAALRCDALAAVVAVTTPAGTGERDMQCRALQA